MKLGIKDLLTQSAQKVKQRLELKLLTILETKNGLLLYFLKPN